MNECYSACENHTAAVATKRLAVEGCAVKDDKTIAIARDGSRRTPSRTRKARVTQVGQLERLLRMPLDIFCEVAGHSHPRDLLAMSRSSKDLRSLLTSKKSKSIWRAARCALKLPDCPPDMSEMQYADLLFGDMCYFCPDGIAKSTFFSNRLRLCNNCRVRNMVVLLIFEEYNLKRQGVWGMLHLETFPGVNCYYLKDAETVWEELHSFEKDSEEQKTFITRKKQSVAETNKHAEEVHKWIHSWEQRSKGDLFQ